MTATRSELVDPKRPRRPNPWLRGPVLFAACLVSAVVPTSRLVFGPDGLRLTIVVLAAALILLALGYVARAPYPWLWVSGAVLVPAGALISGTNSSVRGSLAVGITLALMCLLVPFILSRLLIDNPRAGRTIGAWFVGGQSVSAAAGALQLLGVAVGEGLIFGRATGLATHPNVLGLMCSLALIACVAAWSSSGALVRWLLAGCIALNALTLVGTGSLSAMLALLVALAYGIIAARRVIGTTVSVVLIVGLGFVLTQVVSSDNSFLASIGYRLTVVAGEGDGSGGAASLDVREQTYQWAWASISSSPFVGVGLDPLNAGTFDGVTVVHNYLLRGWYQGGILVVLWFALVTLTVLALLVRTLRSSEGSWHASATLLILVFGATSAFLHQAEYWLPLLFAIVTAGAFPPKGSTRPLDRAERSPSIHRSSAGPAWQAK